MANSDAQVVPVVLGLSNVFLVRGERWVLVDAGAPGDAEPILRAARRHGVQPRDIALILLTHGHVDHFGAAADLRRATGAPVAVHRADVPTLRAGRNPDALVTLGLEGRMFRPFLPWSAPSLEPDIAFDGDFDLRPYGLDACTLHTPGHSPGHVAVPLAGGGLIAGDLLRGGFLGGRLLGGRPNLPFYAEDAGQLAESLARALALPVSTLYVGHGGPLDASRVRHRLAAGALTVGARAAEVGR
jgi:hydroxyacylglutathione hydrolase